MVAEKSCIRLQGSFVLQRCIKCAFLGNADTLPYSWCVGGVCRWLFLVLSWVFLSVLC